MLILADRHFCLKGVEDTQVTVNGKVEEIPDGLSVAAYLDRRQAKPDSLVVQLNGAVLAGTRWPAQMPRAGDRLEVVRFVQGG